MREAQLRDFIADADLGSVRGAARRLKLSQGAISKNLLALLLWSAHGVEPTEYGKVLLRRARLADAEAVAADPGQPAAVAALRRAGQRSAQGGAGPAALKFAPMIRPMFAALLVLALLLVSPQVLAAPGSVQLDELTWTEVRDALRTGATTVIVPVGGTEQNGPHMALGKHNFRVRALAERIATRLGKTLVAPVMTYVPEGRVSPPSGHMRFPGTLSVPDEAFAAVLAGAARSLKQHGFQNIVVLGDSGNYQRILGEVAQRLNREWAGSTARAHHVAAYYRAATDEFAQALKARGITEAQIGMHAGLADTSLMLAVDPDRVRPEIMRIAPAAEAESGVSGEPSQSSAALGRIGTELIVDQTVQAIRAATARRR